MARGTEDDEVGKTQGEQQDRLGEVRERERGRGSDRETIKKMRDKNTD